MIKLLDKSRISLFTYFFVFCFIAIYAGKASIFARDLGDIRTVGNAFALGLTVICILVNKMKFTRDYGIVVGIFLVYALVTALVYHVMSTWWITVHFLLITYAYVLTKSVGSRLLVVYETIIFHLVIIGIFFWIILLLSPSLLETIVRTFQFSEPQSEDGNVAANMIIYTLSNYEYGISEFSLSFMRRNPGFAWEPGAFASMLCLAIFCNLIRTNFRISKNPVLWVFLVALFSTQSTTGLAILVVMLLVWLFTSRKFGWAIAVIPLALALFNLSFFGDKLLSQQELAQSMDIANARGQQDRFFSLMLDWQEFLRHPILGLGCNWQNTWLAENGYDISTVSGIGDLISTYGAVITLLFLWMLIKSSKAINWQYNTRNGYILIFVILMTMVSYAIWTTPIYIAFWLYGVWGVKSSKQIG